MSISKLSIFSTCLVLILGLLATAPSLAQSPPPEQSPFVPGEILVKFRADTGVLNVQGWLQAQGLRPMEVSPYSNVIRVQVPPGQEQAVIDDLLLHENVAFAGVNTVVHALLSPNDPDLPLQWGLPKINAPQAWDIHTGGAGTVIAMIDSGVDLDHQDLQTKIWLNNDEIPANGLDDDGNGFVDDTQGYDFYNNDSDPTDDNGHGTHVAGIAAAQSNNGLGIAGLDWGTKVMALKILNASGNGSIAGLATAIYYAVDNGATLINLSLGGGCGSPSWNQIVQPAIDEALSKNLLIVAASGNNGSSVFCPAALPGVMAVGATTASDTRYASSNYGPELSVAAPGVRIYSTVPDGYNYKTGTSMATSYVSGLATLLWSFSPDLLHTDVRSIIEATADDLGPAGWDPYFGHGRINARRSLEALVSLQTNPGQVTFLIDDSSGPLPSADDIQIISGDSANITWTAGMSPTVSWLNWGSSTAGSVSAASSPVSVTLVPTRPAAYGKYQTTVVITGTDAAGQSLGIRTIPVYLNYVKTTNKIYLPLIYKNASFKPDLIIENIVATSQAVTVTIKNQGSSSVTDAFWVDLYFNPGHTPELNRPWDAIAGHGLVWGVTTPLAPQDRLTLTTGADPYFSLKYSSSPPWPVDVPVYGLVDSINYATTYGAVQESNEANNLFGPVLSTAGVGSSALKEQSESVRENPVVPIPER